MLWRPSPDSHRETSDTPITGETGLPSGPPPLPSLFAAQSLGFAPDPTQAAFLDTTAHNVILCCTRQWGKSTVCAIKALHFALSHPGTTTLIASPSLRQSSEFLAKAASFLEILEITRRTDGRNSRSLLLPNRSRLVAIPANRTTTRGFSPHLLLVDEAAFVPDELIHALLPSLAATSGAFWLLSTPNGQSGFYYDTWHAAQSDVQWQTFRVPATDCPRISAATLAAQRTLLGEQVFKSEYLCEFTAAPGQIFPASSSNPASTPTKPPGSSTCDDPPTHLPRTLPK